MKVLLYIPEYPPYHIGGGGIVYKNLVENLQKKGFNVVVVWGFYPTTSINENIKKYIKNNITFYQIPEIPYLKSTLYLRTAMPPNIKGIFHLPHIIKEEKPDIIHFHGYGLPFIGYGVFLSIILNIPYVFTVHGYPKSPENNLFFNLFWKLYQRIVMTLVLKKANKITAISKWLRQDERLKPYKEKCSIIYNGIDLKKYQKDQYENKKFQENRIIPKDAQFMVSVGRISKMKGFHLVIKVLPKLLQRYQNLYYVIIGDDDGYKADLISLSKELGVENHIIFTGFIDENKKLNYLKESNAYIVPSLWEPFGLTALEGLAMKKIVATTGTGGLKEFLKESSNVLFFNKDDEESLYKVLTKILDEKAIYQEDNYLDQFNWNAVIDQYIRVYENVIGENMK